MCTDDALPLRERAREGGGGPRPPTRARVVRASVPRRPLPLRLRTRGARTRLLASSARCTLTPSVPADRAQGEHDLLPDVAPRDRAVCGLRGARAFRAAVDGLAPRRAPAPRALQARRPACRTGAIARRAATGIRAVNADEAARGQQRAACNGIADAARC
jgi:hypothetical protein